MTIWEKNEHYYSGQGVMMIAVRNALTGKPKAFFPVGNVSDLKVTAEVTNLEHKESKTGQRGTDKRIATETKVGFAAVLENFDSENLARALRGTRALRAAGSAVAQPIAMYPGGVTALEHIKVSAVVVDEGATELTAYVDENTPWDYIVNEEAGSIKFNDGSELEWDGLGVAATAVAVGATTVITVANTAAVGDTVWLRGFTGADAANINDQQFTISAATSTTITIAVDTTGDTITHTGSKVVINGAPGTVDYTYEEQYEVVALTEGTEEVFVRFEGLNTAEANVPVVVEVFKVSLDPLKELALISDTIQQFNLEGSALADATRLTGSKYFRVLKTV